MHPCFRDHVRVASSRAQEARAEKPEVLPLVYHSPVGFKGGANEQSRQERRKLRASAVRRGRACARQREPTRTDSKLLFGIFPIKTVFERSRKHSGELDTALNHIMDWDGRAVLDKLLNRVLACENIAEVEQRFKSV